MDSPKDQAQRYTTRMPVFWWVHKREHIRFITRELTSVFVASSAVFLLLMVRAVAGGQDAYERFLERAESTGMIVFQIIALMALVYHSVTWFNLTPKAMVIKIGARRVPAVIVTLSNYVGWIVISSIIGWFLLDS